MKPLTTEKAIMMVEAQNVLTFQTNKNLSKDKIKEEIENLFDVKVEKVRTLVRDNKKYAYVRLNKKDLAIDVATKLGLI